MTDIALVFKDNGLIDLDFDGSDLVLDEGLETAVLVSLFVNARATVEQLPLGETSLGGFWGDVVTEVEGDATGSLLWLLQREKALDSVAVKARDYARQALQWFIDDNVASSVEVRAEIRRDTIPENPCLRLEIDIARPQGDESLKFDILWQAQQVKRVA